VRWTVMFGAAMVCVGLTVSSLGEPWHLYVGHGLFIVSSAMGASMRHSMFM